MLRTAADNTEPRLDLLQLVSPIQAYLEGLHATFAALREGEVATYIPELAKADAEWFGICIATTDGHVYEVGDTRQLFTIQSISKPFVYGLALEDRGRAAVLAKIGVEPTGDAFNSISLAPGTGCPLNPMINAGAIAAASLVAGHSPEDTFERVCTAFSTYAGRSLTLDRAVFESERETGHRNRAIGHMLRNFGIITTDPEPALNLYFQQCSIAVDCRDLAMMAATLANGGVNPRTRERAVRLELVDSILSVMATCGMYDYAGEWVYWVGLPAKSGVAGGVLAVLPGQLGIGVFSPRLDSRGNSVRGVAVCKELSRTFNLHFLRAPRPAHAAIRAQHTLTDISSKRRRSAAERQVLDAVADRVRVYDLQGDLPFAAVESIVRTLVDASPRLDTAVIDLKRVERIDACAVPLFERLVVEFGTRQKQVVLVNGQKHPKFVRAVEEALTTADEWGRLVAFSDLDAALEWCERRLLAQANSTLMVDRPITLAEHEVCNGLSPDMVAVLQGVLERRSFAAGTWVIRKGDPADALYLLMRGQVSVVMTLPSGEIKRLATFPAGMAFGELAIIDRGERTADVRADTATECDVLSVSALDRLGETHSTIKMKILENLLRHVSRTVSRLNQEVSALSA
jgi:glutaminase